MKKKLIGAILVGALGVSILAPTMTTNNKRVTLLAQPQVGMTVVALGANNNAQQQQELLNGFGVSKQNENVMFLNVTNQDIAKEEGYKGNINNIKNENSFSSVKVTILPAGSGIQVTTNNLTQVTGNMLASVLTTCGITDASIVANAPMPVTGQAALAGVMMAFTKATGKVIPEKNKEVANQEVNTTSNIAKTIGQDKAEQVITQAKGLVIKDNPNSNIEVNNIVNNVVNNNGVGNQLTAQQKEQITNLMEQIKGLNLKESNVEKTLNNIQDSIKKGKENFTELSNKLQQELQENNSEIGKADSILHKILNWIENFIKGNKPVENNSTQLLNVVDFSTITPNSRFNTARNTAYGDVVNYLESQNVNITRGIQNQVINEIKGITDESIVQSSGYQNNGTLIPVVKGDVQVNNGANSNTPNTTNPEHSVAQFNVANGNSQVPVTLFFVNNTTGSNGNTTGVTNYNNANGTNSNGEVSTGSSNITSSDFNSSDTYLNTRVNAGQALYAAISTHENVTTQADKDKVKTFVINQINTISDKTLADLAGGKSLNVTCNINKAEGKSSSGTYVLPVRVKDMYYNVVFTQSTGNIFKEQ